MKKVYYILFLSLALTACSSIARKPSYQKYFDPSQYYYIQESVDIEDVARYYYINGLIKYHIEEYAEAIIELLESTRYKESPLTYIAIAKCYFEYEMLPQTFQYIEEAFKLDPEYMPAIKFLYEVNSKIHNVEGMEKCLEWLVELSPTNDNIKELAYFHYNYYDLRNAEPLYFELSQKSEMADDIEVFLKLFDIYNRLEKTEKINELIPLLKSKKDNKQYKFLVYKDLICYYVQYGYIDDFSMILNELDDEFAKWEIGKLIDEAVFKLYFMPIYSERISYFMKEMSKILLKYSENFKIVDAEVYYYLGALAKKLEDSLYAEMYFNRYFASNGYSHYYFQEIYKYFYLKDNLQTFLLYLLSNASNYEDEFLYPYYTGIAYYDLDSIEQSKNYLLKAIKIDSNNVETLIQLGIVCQMLKNYEESDFYNEKALELEPDNAFANNNYAYYLAERGQYLDRALEMIEKAIEYDSTDSNFLDTYGWIFYKLGYNEKALYYLDKSVEIDSTNIIVWLHIGDVLKDQGKELEAIEAWEKGLKIAPDNVDLLDRVEK